MCLPGRCEVRPGAMVELAQQWLAGALGGDPDVVVDRAAALLLAQRPS